jgi:hypothetical protein
MKLKQLHRFTARHFGVNAGYAQQYLFHYARVVPDALPVSKKPTASASAKRRPATLKAGGIPTT